MTERTMLDITPEEVQRILETQTKHILPPGSGGQETILGVPKDIFLARHAPLKWKAWPAGARPGSDREKR
tara:strand:- start:69 stop:278 length:210 start_codon:yes stop_codon:yes gene_type:complete